MLGKTALISAVLSLAFCIPTTSVLGGSSLGSIVTQCDHMDNLLFCRGILNELSTAHEECTLENQFNRAVEIMLDGFSSVLPKTQLIWTKLLAIARDAPTNKIKSWMSGRLITPTEAKKFLILDMQNFYYVDGLSDFGWTHHKTLNCPARKNDIAIENMISGSFLDCASCVNFEADDLKQATDYFRAELDHYDVTPKVLESDLKPSKKVRRKRVPVDQEVDNKEALRAELDHYDANWLLSDGVGSIQGESVDLKPSKTLKRKHDPTHQEIEIETKSPSASDE